MTFLQDSADGDEVCAEGSEEHRVRCSSPSVIGKGSPPGHSTRGRPGSYSRMTPLGSEDESAVMSGCDVTWTAPPARPQGYAMVFLLSAECGRRAARRNILVAADFTDRWGAGRRMGGRPAWFAALRRLPGPGAMDPGVPTQIGRRARPLHHTCGFTFIPWFGRQCPARQETVASA